MPFHGVTRRERFSTELTRILAFLQCAFSDVFSSPPTACWTMVWPDIIFVALMCLFRYLTLSKILLQINVCTSDMICEEIDGLFTSGEDDCLSGEFSLIFTSNGRNLFITTIIVLLKTQNLSV